MTTIDWQQRAHEACTLSANLPSPCNAVCTMSAPGAGPEILCRGCWRTLSEIGDWANMSDDEKRAVWQRLPGRAAQGKA